ncbi:MAG TPA: hypothetical protein VJ890_17075 [Vineibacter sp.]|nr:hypothetical protein [Vineibacter sp.]
MTTPRPADPAKPVPKTPPDRGDTPHPVKNPPRGGDRPSDTPTELPPRDPTLRRIGPEDEDRRRDERDQP